MAYTEDIDWNLDGAEHQTEVWGYIYGPKFYRVFTALCLGGVVDEDTIQYEGTYGNDEI